MVSVAALVSVGVLAVVLVGGGSTSVTITSSTTEPTTTEPTTTEPATTAPTTTASPAGTAVVANCALPPGLVARSCAIITPPSVTAGEKLPVVVLLPGLGAGPVEIQGVGDWRRAVVDRRFMLVSPQGVADSWNAGSCCGIARGAGVDDVDYLNRLIDEVSARSDVDPKRIFMAGFSNGGMMTYRYVCAHGDRLAAAASVAGTKVISCAPPHPVPMLHIHGTGDQVVPYGGGQGIGGVLLNTTFAAVPGSVAELASQERCPAPVAVSDEGRVHIKEWAGCSGDVRVRLVTIDNWPHEWPLGGPFNATAATLDFFGISSR